MTTRSQHAHQRGWLLVFLAAVVAIGTVLGLAGTASAASSAGTVAGAETRVGAFDVAGQVAVGSADRVGAGQRLGEGTVRQQIVVATGVAANGATRAERLFTNRFLGVDSRILGNSYARGSSGLLNQTGSRLKFGWTSSGQFGGGWHLRMGAGRNPAKPNQALRHRDFGSTHVPNDMANDLLDVIRQLNGLL